jgi:septal ring factor EnvC (AmiA/AmiB activator)
MTKSKKIHYRAILILCLLAAITGLVQFFNGPPAAQEVNDPKSSLDEIKRSLDEERKKVKAYASAEKSVISQLSRLDRKMDKLKAELEILDRQKAEVDKKIEISAQAIRKLSGQVAAQRRKLARRIVAIYKFNTKSLNEILFSSATIPQLVENIDYFYKIVEHDHRLFESYRQATKELSAEKKKLVEESKRIVSIKSSIFENQKTLSQEEQKKKKLLSAIKKEKALHLEMVRDLEAAAQRLTTMIEGMDKVAGAAAKIDIGIIASLKGKLPLPVTGNIISGFGKQVHPVFKTVTFRKGIEIDAKYGDDIRSVFPGKVAYVGWMRGYGQLLILSHEDHYYTLFAHTSKILVNIADEVKKGQKIAEIGDTGSLKGPILYFEIRHRSKPQNPLDWLDRKQIKYSAQYRKSK